VLPFLGPAFIACVAYIDPDNFATNIQSGSMYGYTLFWVIALANL
jgi:manganese transport protein